MKTKAHGDDMGARKAQVESVVRDMITSFLPNDITGLVCQYIHWGTVLAHQLLLRFVQPSSVDWSESAHLTAGEFRWLMSEAASVFLKDSTLLNLDPNRQCQWSVLGNIFGDYCSLVRFLREFGIIQADPHDRSINCVKLSPDCKLLLLGSLVDHGTNSVDTLALVCAMKLVYPEFVFVLRGKHECRTVSRVYGFYDECKRAFLDAKCWTSAILVFDCMPLAAVLGERVFCCHGGISPHQQPGISGDWSAMTANAQALSQEMSLVAGAQRVWRSEALDIVARIHRPIHISDDGLPCDLLWSEPDGDSLGWNERPRSSGFCFGADVLANFLRGSSLKWILRAQQVNEDGFEYQPGYGTLFSCPRFVGEFDNPGAGLIFSRGHERVQMVTLHVPAGVKSGNGQVSVVDVDCALLASGASFVQTE